METYQTMNAVQAGNFSQTSALNAGAALVGQQLNVAQAPKQSNAMEAIVMELERKIQTLLVNNNRLDQIRIRLQGERPSNECGQKVPTPSGILGRIADCMNTVDALLNAQSGVITDLEKYV